ncbi:MAG TPA: flagellar basal body-associated protein FliL [Halomonas sp.]|nr:flagellar basal body-associated protein FliL [Halomonas sp.]
MASSKGGSRKMLRMMMVLVVLSLGAAAAAIYLVLNPGEPANQVAMEEAPPERQAPIFVEVEPFTVNLADDDYGTRLLYAGMTFKVANDETRTILAEHMPQVRSRLVGLLSGQQARDLMGPEGKSRLADRVIETLDRPMTENQPTLAIDEVLFTEFIVQ